VYRSGSIYRSLLISPRDRDGFLDELARRANHLERVGDSLIMNAAIHGSPIESASE
jgi:hypothetical protein